VQIECSLFRRQQSLDADVATFGGDRHDELRPVIRLIAVPGRTTSSGAPGIQLDARYLVPKSLASLAGDPGGIADL
jgi:hypothetical protein